MKRNLPWFALIILISAILWQSVFGAICAPKAHETLQIFVTADYCNNQRIKDSLQALPVKEVYIASHSVTNAGYNDYLTTVGLLSSDLLIVDSAIFDAEYAWQEFAPLEESLLSQYGLDPKDYRYVTVEGTPYGIVVYNKNMGIDLLSDYLQVCEADRQYCIVVNRNTPNAAPFSWEEPCTDNAFRALATLLKGANIYQACRLG